MRRSIIIGVILVLALPFLWAVFRYRTIDTCKMVEREFLSQLNENKADTVVGALARTAEALGTTIGQKMIENELAGQSWFDCVGALWKLRTSKDNPIAKEAASNLSTAADELSSALDAPRSDKPVKPEWHVSRTTNPIDDSPTVVLSLASSDSPGVSLLARCKSNKTDVYINFNTYLGNDGRYNDEYKVVTSRFDSERASTAEWGLSTDNEAAFVPGAVIYAKKIAEAQTLVVQTTPYGDSPLTATFELSGARERFAELANTCHWNLD